MILSGNWVKCVLQGHELRNKNNGVQIRQREETHWSVTITNKRAVFQTALCILDYIIKNLLKSSSDIKTRISWNLLLLCQFQAKRCRPSHFWWVLLSKFIFWVGVDSDRPSYPHFNLCQLVANLAQWLCPRQAILLLYLQFLILQVIPSTTLQPQPPWLSFPGQLSSVYIYLSNCSGRWAFISKVRWGEQLYISF